MSFRKPYGYAYSENGWRMCDHNETVTVKVVPGSVGAPIRAGAAATILNAWLIEYDRHVEPITSQVWGWSRENDVPNSNHLSGTALDIGAPKYPWGLRRMPADVVVRVRAALTRFDGAVFWGASWTKPDQMHYQLAWPEGDRRNDAFAAKLESGYLGIYGDQRPAPAPAPPVLAPVNDAGLLRRGSSGGRVADLQRHMNAVFPAYSRLTVDGLFGPATEAVIREAQRRGAITVDGIVGPETERVIVWNG